MRRLLARAALLAALVTAVLPVSAAGRTVTIAVVRDGPSEHNKIVEQIRPELEHLVGADHTVVFDLSDEYDAAWDPARLRPFVQAALRDRDVDIVLGIGILVTQEAARPDLPLTKPFVSATILDGDLPKIEFSQADQSLKDNLSLVIWPQRVDSDVEAVRILAKPTRLYVGVDELIARNLAGFESTLDGYAESYGLEIEPVYFGDDWRGAVAALDPAEAVFYLSATPRLSLEERASLIGALNDKNIPTFSGVGAQDLDLGVLATNKPDVRRELARRVALNLYRLITGVETDDLPVLLVADTKLVLNGRTAAVVGYQPFFETRAVAKILHPEAFERDAAGLDIPQLLEMAEKGNASLAVSRAQLETSLRDRQVARSPLLPQLGINGDYSYYDNNLVGNVVPERWGRVGVTLRQMIFDDELVSGFRSSDRFYRAAQYQNESDRLDVFLEAEAVYFDFVQARLLYEIQQNNLELTEGNLEIARMRAEVGHSGRDEVYRWEAEVARRRTVVLSTESLVESARISLNQVLGVEQDTRWMPQPVDLDSGRFESLKEKMGFASVSTDAFSGFVEAIVEVAMENSPELSYLHETIAAQEIRVGYRKRSFIVPRFFADVSYNNNVYQSPDEPRLGDYGLEARVFAELPLFEGTGKIYDSKREQARLMELEQQLVLASQLVERRARTALRQMQSSIPNIKYTGIAAENARRNFDVVREKYANGIVTITDLLEAQTASLRADLDATSAVYAFMQDLTELQRAVSFFTHDKTEAEVDAFLDRVKEKMGAE